MAPLLPVLLFMLSCDLLGANPTNSCSINDDVVTTSDVVSSEVVSSVHSDGFIFSCCNGIYFVALPFLAYMRLEAAVILVLGIHLFIRIFVAVLTYCSKIVHSTDGGA